MIFEEIQVKFPRTARRLEKSYESCANRKKYVELNKKSYSDHLELAKDDLNSLKTDFHDKNWRWTIIKSYYASMILKSGRN